METRQPDTVLFSRVDVFDGRSERLTGPVDVLIRGEKIAAIGTDLPSPEPGEQRTVIDGAGKTLIPGLIDAHAHIAFGTMPAISVLLSDPGYVAIQGAKASTDMLMRGFTTARDAGGPTFGIKKAIDKEVVAGPRIYPSGAFISQTSGHGDYRLPYEVPRGSHGHLAQAELLGAAVIADGVDEVLRGAREQFMLGASQLKMMAGGGAASQYDPIDVTEYTEAELRAGVDAAENWGTYVMVHAYTDRAVQQAIRAGVKCIEHGHLLSEETVAMMAEHDVWWSMQTFLDDEDAIQQPTPQSQAKFAHVVNGTDRAWQLGLAHGVKMAWGTDTLFDAKLASRQGAQLAKMQRWMSPGQALIMATSRNAELLALSGPRNPYPGRLGVVEPDALADLILVDGNPLENLDLISTPDESFAAIMKNGVLHKTTP